MKKVLVVLGILVIVGLVYWGSTSKQTATGTIKNVSTVKPSDTVHTVVMLESQGPQAKTLSLVFCGTVSNRIPAAETVVEFGYSPRTTSAGTVECNKLDRVRVIR